MPNLGPLLPSLFLFLITLPERLLTWCPIDRQETTKGRLALMAQRPAMSPTFAAAHLLPLKVALPRTPYGSLGSLSTEVPGVPRWPSLPLRSPLGTAPIDQPRG